MKQQRKYRAVIFDKDGVLVDTEQTFDQWLQEHLNNNGIYLTEEERTHFVGYSSPMCAAYLDERFPEVDGYQIWQGFLEQSARKSFSHRDYIFPGVPELLEWLAVKQVPIGLASAADLEDVKHFLAETGFEAYIKTFLSSELVNQSKPDPEIYLKVAEKMGVNPEDCIAVEDSYAGILAAKRAGMYVIARRIDWLPIDQSMADCIVETTEEIQKNIQKMLLN